ncbi:MAG: AsmA-like C-terminal region-containing protein [Gallionella sp.]|nr:AsmA-like C-terminal region-containing protein [Gallionella sp.]
MIVILSRSVKLISGDFMRFVKRFWVWLAAFTMLALLALYLTPLEVYVPKVERDLSERLHIPVSIERMRIAMSPLPHLELHGVRLGAGGIVFALVDVTPDMAALLAGRLEAKRVSISDGSARLTVVRQLADVLFTAGAGVAVREVQLTRMLLPEADLGPFEGKLTFGADGMLARAWFALDERKLTATALPMAGRRFAVQVEAHDWAFRQMPQVKFDDLRFEGILSERELVVPKFVAAAGDFRASGSVRLGFADGWSLDVKLASVETSLQQVSAMSETMPVMSGAMNVRGRLQSSGADLKALQQRWQFTGEVGLARAALHISAAHAPPFFIDEAKAKVLAEAGRLELRPFGAKLYGGHASGTATIERKRRVLNADVAVKGVAVQPLVKTLSNEVLLTGSMDGGAKFSMKIDDFDTFPANLRLTGSFHLQKGVLSKVDLVQAASNVGTPSVGGATRFDDLSGLIRIDAAGYHFRDLKIVSGSLHAEGRLDIDSSLSLNGALDADMKGTGWLMSVPVVVYGSLEEPRLRPSGSALAGAAVGTAVLGPGLGTAVGVRLGGFLNRLFGDSGEEKNDGKPPKQAPKKP